jgi:hypothetical protein
MHVLIFGGKEDYWQNRPGWRGFVGGAGQGPRVLARVLKSPSAGLVLFRVSRRFQVGRQPRCKGRGGGGCFFKNLTRRRRRPRSILPSLHNALARGGLGAGWSTRVNSSKPECGRLSQGSPRLTERALPLPRSLEFDLGLGSRPNFASRALLPWFSRELLASHAFVATVRGADSRGFGLCLV